MTKNLSLEKKAEAVLNSVVLPSVNELVKLIPPLAIPWAVIYGSYRLLLEIEQQKINEFVKFIRDNKTAFVKDIVETTAFKEGFVITFDQYIKQRRKEKREVIQRVFLGFTQSSDKDNFEIERLYNVVNSISLEGIEYLKFIDSDILPVRKNDIKKQAELHHSVNHHSLEKEIEILNLSDVYPVVDYVNKWIDDNYSPNSEKVIKKYKYDGKNHDVLDKIYDDELPQIERKKEIISEFISLGVFRIIYSGGSIGGGGTNKYTLTKFGYELISFLK